MGEIPKFGLGGEILGKAQTLNFSSDGKQKPVINQNQNYYPIVVNQSNPLQLQNDEVSRILTIEQMPYESQSFKGL